MTKEQLKLKQTALTYIGTKQVQAINATYDEFLTLTNKDKGEIKSTDDLGMIVFYQDNYISWSPLDVFEEAYRCTTKGGMNFALAVEATKRNSKIRRPHWDKDEYIVLMPGYPLGIPANEATAKQHHIPRGTWLTFRPYFQKRIAGYVFTVYNPTTEDILADDWVIAE